jgi:lipoprotein-anchoring transpeptidase ErfK/SrfK
MRPRWRRRSILLAWVGAVAAIVASAAALRPAAEPPAAVARHLVLPAPVVPAFVPGAPRGLGPRERLSQWAPVRHQVAVRAAPASGAQVIAILDTDTPEGTDNIVSVLARRRDRAGRTWVRARLPSLPPGAVGWIPRAVLGGYTAVDARLDVDLETLTLTLYRSGRRVLRAPIGVGAAGWETPPVMFYIRNKLTRYRSPEYGPVAFGTSARSDHATDWPAGGFVGIHGTDRPDLLPGRVSHGCIRLRNADVLALARLLPIGTPVRVH